MPSVLEKQKVLGGRGEVFTYKSTQVGKYFYREKVAGTKRYRTKLISGARTLIEAVELASETAIALREEDPHHRSLLNPNRPVAELDSLQLLEREEKLLKKKERMAKAEKVNGKKSIPVQDAIDDYLKSQQKRVDAGTFAKNSYLHKFYCLKHIAEYLADKGIKRTSQISETTFDDYLIFRSGTTRINQKRELAVLGEWMKRYLLRFKYLNSDLWLKGNFLPKVEVRMVDRQANPAINADDWRVIVDYVRDEWRDEAKSMGKKSWFYRNMFWHYILLSKNSGMSVEEVLKLKWKNVEIRDVGRLSQTKAQEEIEAVLAEAQMEGKPIEIIPPDITDPNKWVPEETWGREQRLVAYISTIRSKTKQGREIPCNQGKELSRWMKFVKGYLTAHDMKYKITGDDYVFANPENGFKKMHQNRIGSTWRGIITKLKGEGKLKGHKFSDHRYTLYSMRSTFIEEHLIQGTDIFLLARIAGHSVKELMESYERMDIRKRAEEVTAIDYGKKKQEPKVVNLLDDDE